LQEAPLRRTLLALAQLLGPLPILAGLGPAPQPPPAVSDDPNDWPMYNRDVIGTRHNPAEKPLTSASRP
jgi:hypothetical protein